MHATAHLHMHPPSSSPHRRSAAVARSAAASRSLPAASSPVCSASSRRWASRSCMGSRQQYHNHDHTTRNANTICQHVTPTTTVHISDSFPRSAWSKTTDHSSGRRALQSLPF